MMAKGKQERATIVWFRLDLRVADHPALAAAAKRGGPVVPVFIWAPEEEGAWPPGAASRWWLHHSLASLDASLRRRSSRLVVCTGPSLRTLRALVEETGATAVYWSRRYEPMLRARDAQVEDSLREQGVETRTFNAALLVEPTEVLTRQGGPFKVFTPFWRAAATHEPPAPLDAPRKIAAPGRWPSSKPLKQLPLLPDTDWAGGMRAAWTPGEAGAAAMLHDFLAEAAGAYDTLRDIPGTPGTSRLSPHLHFGEVSPHAVYHAVQVRMAERTRPGWVRAAESYLRQLYWREFAHHLLWHFPHTAEEPLNRAFRAFPWQSDAHALRAWRKGRTGYPIVDAGMRELWASGWMHNRVRMIAASFLVKDLLLPWQEGARWFWDTLVDADLANNTLGWQWVAGCGADAAPYFRVFNPELQGRKFDPDGTYVRTWIPELAHVPGAGAHAPQVRQGGKYPAPIVNHQEARGRALAAYESVKTWRALEP